MVPLWETVPFFELAGTVTVMRPSPAFWRVTSEPAAKATLPSRVSMEPLLETVRPMRKTSPCRARMVPELLTTASESPLNVRPPLPMNCSLERSRLEAKNPLVLMDPDAVMRIPFGLMRPTRALETSCPAISDGMLPITRLSTAELAFGWMKLVICPVEIENDCQSITVRSVAVVMFSALPAVSNVAPPTATCAPSGFAPTMAVIVK